MREIISLSDQTISQIAAGEIVENPASIIKELVENAIDAKATSISIRLSENLLDEIRISDNGEGIPKDQIKKAFNRHATSKLRTISDLSIITSLGFRGEALASIANISNMECITKTDDEPFGYSVSITEGKVSDVTPVGSATGTTMIVRDVFYNTPVRKQFLKSSGKEIRQIIKMVELIALSRKDISFHLLWDRKTLLQSHASGDNLNHIFSILGKEIAKNLVPIEFETESYRIEGYVGNNLLHRSTPEREYIFVNGRGVKSDDISNAVRKVYRSLIPLHHYPVFILYLTIDPVLIDVNIHPQKQTVRLSNHNQIAVLLERLVARALEPNREIPVVEEFTEPSSKTEEVQKPEKTIFQLHREKEDALKGMEDKKQVHVPERVYEPKASYGSNNEEPEEESERKEVCVQKAKPKVPPLDVELYEFLAVIFRTYILFENKRDHRVLLVDQHAAHERILYEKYSRAIDRGAVSTQLLLDPIQIHLTPEEMQLIETYGEAYSLLGFAPEPFGENTVLIREVPQHILIPDIRQFFLDSLHSLDKGVDVKEQHIYKIMRLACRSAIKAGDRLSEEEAYALLDELNRAETPFTCPHGRPTMIHLEKRTFEKLFLREGI